MYTLNISIFVFKKSVPLFYTFLDSFFLSTVMGRRDWFSLKYLYSFCHFPDQMLQRLLTVSKKWLTPLAGIQDPWESSRPHCFLNLSVLSLLWVVLMDQWLLPVRKPYPLLWGLLTWSTFSFPSFLLHFVWCHLLFRLSSNLSAFMQFSIILLCTHYLSCSISCLWICKIK